MTWSYNRNLASERDIVRFLIGDVESTDPLVTDAEINAVLAQFPQSAQRPRLAAATIADALAARFARLSLKTTGTPETTVRYGDLSSHYRAVAQQLRGGVSVRLRRGAFRDYTTGGGEEP